MAFDFPNAPSEGAVYSPPNGPSYKYTGGLWRTTAPLIPTYVLPSEVPRNRIVNGAMHISQENGETASAAVAGGGYYCADQWITEWSLTGTAQTAKVSDATSAPFTANTRIQVVISTATASPAAGAFLQIRQAIEGLMIADLKWGTAAAKPIVLRFSCAGTSGTYSVSIRNAGTRTYLAPFTLAATGVVQTFTLAIPGDVTGTWAIDNTAGMHIGFALVTGTTYGGGVAGWQAGNKLQIAGNSNLAATASNYFYVSDVGLYVDPQGSGLAPRFEQPDYGEELLRCQRYFQQWGGNTAYEHICHCQAVTATTLSGVVPLMVPTRDINPSVVAAGSYCVYAANGTVIACTGVSGVHRAMQSVQLNITVASGLVAGNASQLLTNNSLAARFRVNARM